MQARSTRPPVRTAAKRPPRTLIAGGAILLVLAVWLLYPSRYSRVNNLTSSGTAIVAFGDSLTAGYGAGPGEDYPTRAGSQLGVTIENAGVSGDTTAAALTRLDADVLQKSPRVVIVGLGGNDFLRGIPMSTTEQNLREIVSRIQAGGSMVVMLGFSFPSITADYDAMYERVADDTGALLVEDMLDGILSDESLKSDQIHPNARGYAVMAERVSGPLRRLLREADDAR